MATKMSRIDAFLKHIDEVLEENKRVRINARPQVASAIKAMKERGEV